MYTVFVAGAHGRTGRHIIKALQKGNYNVRGLVRSEEQRFNLLKWGAMPYIGDLNTEFSEGIIDADAVICAVGAGDKSDPEEIDHLGTVRLIEQSELLGVKRFILISSMGTLEPERMPKILKPYLSAKRRAEKVLEASTLCHTILRPGGLTDELPTGKVSVHQEFTDLGFIPRSDLAQAAVLALTLSETENTSFNLVAGDTPIAQALQSLEG
ncbi:SDR family oxidoreductase [Paenibacillus lentus]|uniref:SDR family oxidoreductase n=1 Tax=Paenibacillus lentus TaxID=1338368 RepID=A0A3S8RS10_9BACL|nr:SDR family oxidoreductase [Paenibacillus lentus]AZK45835.1 SDR family oxidoreductase [Paenibacillus lentus]